MKEKIFYIMQEIIDFFYKIRIKKFFLNQFKNKKINSLIDVGAHRGETVIFFKKFLKINKIYCYEASFENFKFLKNNLNKKNFSNIRIINLGIGEKNEIKKLNELVESQSSTFNQINLNTKYTKRKINFLRFFFKFNNIVKKKINIRIVTLKDEMTKNIKLKNIDILKIDTEGYEYNVLKGLGNEILKIKYIYFEHHFDRSIIKGYKISDIHNYLTLWGFEKKFKIKMPMRKVFDYVYKNIKN